MSSRKGIPNWNRLSVFITGIHNENSGSNRSVRIIEETQAFLSKSKRVSWMCSLAKKYSFFQYILFLLVLTALVAVVVEKVQRIHSLEKTLEINQNGQRQTIKTSTDLLSVTESPKLISTVP